MVHDLARWSDAREFTAAQMPVVRSVIEAFFAQMDTGGLLGPMPGWQFVDWAPGWENGNPPGAMERPHAIFNWHLAYVLQRLAEIESWLGEPEQAQRCRARAERLAARLDEVFYNKASGLYADDSEHTQFSEHTQVLAVLSGLLPEPRCVSLMAALKDHPDATPTTIYFSHYKLEALAAVGDGEALLEAMELWRGLPELGFVTTPEQPEPTRSDCHGWGGHPLYHIVASVLGVQPGSFGFDTVRVRPCPGGLDWARAQVPSLRGVIEASFERRPGGMQYRVELPEGLTGTLVWGDKTIPLQSGENVRMPRGPNRLG
ncbi:MAG: alpha-L-rhamnosidase C-terminal domain-containing protein [Planctomycetota bacterium]